MSWGVLCWDSHLEREPLTVLVFIGDGVQRGADGLELVGGFFHQLVLASEFFFVLLLLVLSDERPGLHDGSMLHVVLVTELQDSWLFSTGRYDRQLCDDSLLLRIETFTSEPDLLDVSHAVHAGFQGGFQAQHGNTSC